jgi:hypothetical protein
MITNDVCTHTNSADNVVNVSAKIDVNINGVSTLTVSEVTSNKSINVESNTDVITIMDTVVDTNLVISTALPTPIVNLVDEQPKLIISIPTRNKFDILTIDDCHLTVPDTQLDIIKLDTPGKKRHLDNSSPETKHYKRQTMSKSLDKTLNNNTTFPKARLTCTDLQINILDDNNLTTETQAKSSDISNHCTPTIITQIEQPDFSNSNTVAILNTVTSLAELCSKAVSRINLAYGSDNTLNNIIVTAGTRNSISNINLLTSDMLPNDFDIAITPTSSEISNTTNTYSLTDNIVENLMQSFSSVDNVSENLIQSCSSVDNNDVVPEILIESFSSTEESIIGSIEQGDFVLFDDKKTAHITIQKTTKVLVIGDSNLRMIEREKLKGRIPKNWTINCIPGANLTLINKLLLELPKKTPLLTDIIISAGMCDNNNPSPQLTTTLKTAISLKKRIHFQGIVINERTLNDNQVKNLTKLNNTAKQQTNISYIQPPKIFSTTSDGIHYQAETVEKIFYSMKMHILHSKHLN